MSPGSLGTRYILCYAQLRIEQCKLGAKFQTHETKTSAYYGFMKSTIDPLKFPLYILWNNYVVLLLNCSKI